jgi:hypothetical protein
MRESSTSFRTRILLPAGVALSLGSLVVEPTHAGDPTPIAQDELDIGTPDQSTTRDWFAVEAKQVHIQDSGNVVHFTAHDAAGNPIGTFRVSAVDGEIAVAAEFPDGSFTIQTVPSAGDDEPQITIDGIPGEIVPVRMQAVVDILGRGGEAQAGWLKCGLTVATTIGVCLLSETGAGAVVCAAGCGFAACECVPLLSEEFEALEC